MREKILRASIPLFDKKGYSETSIQDIVEVLGVTKGTFYYYYKSKQELLKDINVTYIQNLLDEQKKILNDDTKTYREKVYNNMLMVIRTIRNERQSARVFFREMRHLEEHNLKLIIQKRYEFRMNTQHMIEKAIENGEFRDRIRPDILTFGILGMTNWSYYWYNPDGEVSEKELVDLYMELILNGVKN